MRIGDTEIYRPFKNDIYSYPKTWNSRTLGGGVSHQVKVQPEDLTKNMVLC